VQIWRKRDIYLYINLAMKISVVEMSMKFPQKKPICCASPGSDTYPKEMKSVSITEICILIFVA
jgi:hypothetical protein